MYRRSIENILEKALRESFEHERLEELFPVPVELCSHEEYGDYFSPVALRAANLLSLDPETAARTIVEAVEHLPPFCQSIKATVNGFINITVSRDSLWHGLMAVLHKDAKFSNPNFGEKEKVRLVAADTRSLGLLSATEGRFLMQAAFLRRALPAAGYDVYPEGIAVEHGEGLWTLGRRLESRYREFFGDEAETFTTGHSSRRAVDMIRRIVQDDGAAFLSVTRAQRMGALRDKAVPKVAADLRKAIGLLGYECKNWVWTSSFSSRNSLASELIARFRSAGLLYEEHVVQYRHWVCGHFVDPKQTRIYHAEGSQSVKGSPEPDYIYWTPPDSAGEKRRPPGVRDDSRGTAPQVWLKSTAFGDAEDRLLLLPEGEFSDYFVWLLVILSGIKAGYTRNIFLRPAEYAIDFYSRYAAALEYLGFNPRNFEVISVAGTKVTGFSEEQDNARGDSIGFSALVSRLPADSARLFYSMGRMQQPLEIDCRLAEAHTDSNPYFIVSLAYSRMDGVFAAIRGKSIQQSRIDPKDVKNLLGESEENLVRHIIRYPSAFRDAVTNCEPSILIKYILGLAAAFNAYYDGVNIFSGEKDVIRQRIAVVKGCRIIMDKALHIIGLKL